MSEYSALAQLIKEGELKKIKKAFQDKKQFQQKNEYISFQNFSDYCREKIKVKEIETLLEGFKKELKSKPDSERENQLWLSENDYYHYIKEIVMFNNKTLNSKDEAFSIIIYIT